MDPKHLGSGNAARPIGANWKFYWREREQSDPEKRREIRQEKRARRQIKDQLRNWENTPE
ncbi:MAG: hypothetical protein P1V97_36405 [Planctomycetota bacterium]|nr:hypothetical protein [Planctomycetota bacterium]